MRQLTAILFTDIQGYTAIMQKDEELGRILREKFHKNLENEITAHNGKIVQFSGDGALCNFNSAIEAVRAAIELQRRMLEEPKVPLRIGIHSGDVMIEEGNIYGDGVNIASRIESFAVPGGVFVSGKVYDEIKNQNDISAVSLGSFKLKNVANAIEIFAISNPGLTVPKKQWLEGKGSRSNKKIVSLRDFLAAVSIIVLFALAFFLYTKLHAPEFTGTEKSIAVLPFTNLSTDRGNEYFSDGMTQDIITRLSNIADLRVISRTSVMRYKNTMESAKEIAKELHVAAILNGSVQKEGNRVRITAQLVDAATDRQLWAEKYDRELEDIFKIQSDVSELIVLSLNASMTKFQKARIHEKPTENTDAYLLYQQGTYLWNKRTRESIPQSINLYQKAIALDPNFALAYAAIALAYHSMFVYRVNNRDSINTLVMIYARRAMAVDPDLGAGHTALAAYYAFTPATQSEAIRELDKAIALDPNYAYSWLKKGMIYHENGEAEKALIFTEQALQLDPLAPTVLLNRAVVLNLLGRSADAINIVHQIEVLEPDFSTPFFNELRIGILLNLGRFQEALRLSPSAAPEFEAYCYAATANRKRAIEIHDSLRQVGDSDLAFRAIFKFYLEGKDAAFEVLISEIEGSKPENFPKLREQLLSSSMFVTTLRYDRRFETVKRMLSWKPIQ